MRLNPVPFSQIKSGAKTIELRLYDEKRQKVRTDDFIEFTNNVTGEKITVRVAALHIFPSFRELYSTLPLDKCGYDDIKSASYKDMEEYYSQNEQKKYGVVGIEIEPCFS